VIVWDIDSARALATLGTHEDLSSALAFSPEGAILATVGGNSSVVLWETRRWTKIAVLVGHTDGVSSVAFSPDGATLASAGPNDNEVFLWDVQDAVRAGANCATAGECAGFAKLTGHESGVLTVAFSPDGKTLASGSFDKSVIVWDLHGRRELRTLRGHKNDVNAVEFADDGRILVSASSGGDILLWDVTTAKPLADPFHGHVGSVQDVAVSPDGTAVASAGRDGTIRLWAPLPLGHDVGVVRAHLCGVVRRNLSVLESSQFLPGVPQVRTCGLITLRG
jgi:WD40 repeat protein